MVALSSIEAEYTAFSDAFKDGLIVYHSMNEYVQIHIPVHMFVDNQCDMCLANNQVTNKRSNHVDRRYHTIQECVSNGIMKLEYFSIEHNVRDIMTKPFRKVKHYFPNASLHDQKI